MWHDGLRWHSLDEAGQWRSGRSPNHLRVLAEAIWGLPDHPYWDRLKARAGYYGSAPYEMLKWMELACHRRLLAMPADLDKPYRMPRTDQLSQCLCLGDCRYPAVPEDAI
jgi:hypothetical protein